MKDNNPKTRTYHRKPDSEKEAAPGAALMAALWNKMNHRGETPAELASHLGITYAYLMALARGERPIPQVSRAVLVAAAAYLRVPTAQAYLLSEALLTEDFVYVPTVEEKIKRIYEAMLNDPLWMGYALKGDTWENLTLDAKLLVCLLYEKSSRTQFFGETEVEQSDRD